MIQKFIFGFLAISAIIWSTFASPIPQCPSEDPTHASYMADPDDCGAFYECVYGIPIRFECHPGLYYNEALEVCDHAVNVNCGTRPLTTVGPPTQEPPTPEPPTQEPPTPEPPTPEPPTPEPPITDEPEPPITDQPAPPTDEPQPPTGEPEPPTRGPEPPTRGPEPPTREPDTPHITNFK